MVGIILEGEGLRLGRIGGSEVTNPFSFMSFASSRVEKLGKADGDSIIATTSGDADRAYDAEVYAAHGIVSRPSKKTKGLRIRLGSLSIIFAAYTYGVDPPANPGATKVYATDADGVEQATHLLNSDGVHTINEGTKEAARKGDAVQSVATDDATFWAWVSAVSTYCSVTPPPSLTGKITQGTEEVLLP
jgi:hypothetical protein